MISAFHVGPSNFYFSKAKGKISLEKTLTVSFAMWQTSRQWLMDDPILKLLQTRGA